jgi:hypothetical protein
MKRSLSSKRRMRRWLPLLPSNLACVLAFFFKIFVARPLGESLLRVVMREIGNSENLIVWRFTRWSVRQVELNQFYNLFSFKKKKRNSPLHSISQLKPVCRKGVFLLLLATAFHSTRGAARVGWETAVRH